MKASKSTALKIFQIEHNISLLNAYEDLHAHTAQMIRELVNRNQTQYLTPMINEFIENITEKINR